MTRCECGCGKITGLAKRTRRGQTKGQHVRFVQGHNVGVLIKTEGHKRHIGDALRRKFVDPTKTPRWKGGKVTTPDGYVHIHKPAHPRANRRGYVLRSIIIFERATGVSAPRGMVLHHINYVRHDDRIGNLGLMTRAAHTRLHRISRLRREEL